MGFGSMSVLLDTHAAVWLVQGSPRLSEGVREKLAHLERSDIYISDLLLLELSMLIAKGRVVVRSEPTPFLKDFASRFHILPIDAEIAAAAMALELPHADPFDRVFVSTALRHKLPLVSRDRAIRSSGLVDVIW